MLDVETVAADTGLGVNVLVERTDNDVGLLFPVVDSLLGETEVVVEDDVGDAGMGSRERRLLLDEKEPMLGSVEDERPEEVKAAEDEDVTAPPLIFVENDMLPCEDREDKELVVAAILLPYDIEVLESVDAVTGPRFVENE